LPEARVLKIDRMVCLYRKGYITEEQLEEMLKKMKVEDVWAAFNSNDLTDRTGSSILLFNCYLRYNGSKNKENVEALLNFTLTAIAGKQNEKHIKHIIENVEKSRYFKEILKDWEIEIDS